MAESGISEFKSCRKCGERKPIEDFHKHGGRAGARRRPNCRTCYNQGRKARYHSDEGRARHRAYVKAYTARPEVAARIRAYRAKPETKAKGSAARAKWLSKPGVKERQRATWYERRCLPEARAKTLHNACLKRAQKRGLPFDLTLEWLTEKIKSGICEATGLAFDFGPPPNGWNYNPKGPSVDQIDAGGGYTISNCRIVLVAFNNAVGQYGDDLYAEVATAFLRTRGLL